MLGNMAGRDRLVESRPNRVTLDTASPELFQDRVLVIILQAIPRATTLQERRDSRDQ